MQQEAKVLTRRQWVLIAISASLLVVLAVAHGVYRGVHKDDFSRMVKRERIVAACDNSLWGFDRQAPLGSMGMAYEILHAMADSAGIELEINIYTTPGQMLERLDRNYVDIVAVPVAKTEEINRKYLCTEPFFSTPFVVIYNRDYSEAVTLENLPLCQLHVQDNDAIILRLKNLAGELGVELDYQIVPDKTIGELVRLVSASAISYTVCPLQLARQYEKIYGNIACSVPIGMEQEYVWVLKRSRTETLKWVNNQLTYFKND